MSIKSTLQFFRELIDKDGIKNLYVSIPQERTDFKPPDEDIYYFQLWLADMYLTKSRQWGTDLYAAVHASVGLQLEGTEAYFSRVTQGPNNLTRGVFLNYSLTPILPHENKEIELDATLLGLWGKNYLATAINILKDYSELVAPPLNQAIKIAEKVSGNLKELVQATNGTGYLRLHQTFTPVGGGNPLKPGYIAVIGTNNETMDHDRLEVQNSQLYLRESNGTLVPFQNYDYMLFRIATWKDRDWNSIHSIAKPYNQACQAYLRGRKKRGRIYENTAIEAVWESTELVRHDRVRAVEAIQQALEPLKDGVHGAVGQEPLSLNDARALVTIESAQALGEISLESLLAS